MITTGSKWFFGLSALTLVLAAAYGWTTGGSGLGPISVGYKGGVGDHLGYGLLVSISAFAALLGLVSVSTRDADPEALAQLAGTDEPPAARPVRHTYWPIVAGFATACAIVGLVVGTPLFVLGLVVAAVVLVEWMVLAWADNATGDPEANRQIRNRFMNPVEVPAAGVIAVAVIIFAISRVYLSVSKFGAVGVSIGIALLILGGGALVAARPRISSSAVAALLLLGAIGTVAAGVISGAVGEREFEEHEPTHAVHEEQGG